MYTTTLNIEYQLNHVFTSDILQNKTIVYVKTKGTRKQKLANKQKNIEIKSDRYPDLGQEIVISNELE